MKQKKEKDDFQCDFNCSQCEYIRNCGYAFSIFDKELSKLSEEVKEIEEEIKTEYEDYPRYFLLKKETILFNKLLRKLWLTAREDILFRDYHSDLLNNFSKNWMILNRKIIDLIPFLENFKIEEKKIDIEELEIAISYLEAIENNLKDIFEIKNEIITEEEENEILGKLTWLKVELNRIRQYIEDILI